MYLSSAFRCRYTAGMILVVLLKHSTRLASLEFFIWKRHVSNLDAAFQVSYLLVIDFVLLADEHTLELKLLYVREYKIYSILIYSLFYSICAIELEEP